MAIEIRLMRNEELGAVESIYAKVFGDQALDYWRRRFEWQFRTNPATLSRPSQLWVGVREETVLGFVASFPARLKVLDTELTVLCPCDLMVSPDARREGLGERLVRAYIKEAGRMAIALTYSPANARLHNRLGYHLVFAEPTFLRPLRGSRVVRTMAKRWFARTSPLNRVLRLSTPVLGGAGEGVIALANTIRSPRAVGNLRVEVDPIFDTGFDQLWREASKEIPVIFARDARMLQWRFREDPITRHTVFAARDSSGVPAGYAVVCESKRHNLRVGKVMDLFCPPSRAKEVVGVLAASFLRYFLSKGIDLITAKGLHPSIRAELRRFMYLKAPGKETPAQFLLSRDDPLADAVYSADKWHLSHSDGDEDFVP